MFCKQCGAENQDNAFQCVKCGQPLQQPVQPPTAPMPRVPDNLVWAILVTLFCCLPFGIVSIVYAAQVNGKLQAGDYEGAVKASNSAKTWVWVAFGCGLAVMVLYVVGMILFAGGMAGMSHHSMRGY